MIDVKSKSFFSRCVLLLALTFGVSLAQAEETIDSDTIDSWLETTQAFIPMQDVFQAIGENSALAQKYSEEEFMAMSLEKQDDVLDEVLKEQGVYDKIYKVLEDNDWDSAGEYVRVSSRVGQAIAYQMREMLMAKMPEEQQQMMREMAGEVDAKPEDVEVVSDNWDKISAFMAKNMEEGNLPPAAQ
ncbi:hypothetical protein [Gilvimarinus xylanilyticus]|uniref:DUF2059 domain-containing protein n=1 Tax=Gilvimarinus xylanilyticus TaxID=2944139 RepID=A0A9X2HY74_9GAMM|nr:hypothetical protein [Gilvimarinus xylanilyticus]MCP8898681.1 hypothetical protein [Gilvimarinus xylanilyticus]